MYSNGSKEGFHSFQRIVTSLADRYGDQTMWMKLSEIGRYWTAKELTGIQRDEDRITLEAPFGTSHFTIKISGQKGPIRIKDKLREVRSLAALESGTWLVQGSDVIACFDLPTGTTDLHFSI